MTSLLPKGETQGGAGHYAFPELKLSKVLPLDQPVSVEVPVAEARTLTFQCGMGTFRSKLVIA